MQKLIKLPSGSVLAVTNLFYKTPSGKGLDGNGVKPDVCTFEMLEDRNVEGLLRIKNDKCMAEYREDSELELNTALYMLNN
jgi:C-terminal processing protease CtpA/Prc